MVTLSRSEKNHDVYFCFLSQIFDEIKVLNVVEVGPNNRVDVGRVVLGFVKVLTNI